jgi:hypothetical protein
MKHAMVQTISGKMKWMVMATLLAVTVGGAALANAQSGYYNAAPGPYYGQAPYYQDHYYRGSYNGYYDRFERRDPLQIAYDNGYRDGLQRGHYDSRERFRYNIHSQLYNDGRDGYERWMCHFGDYKRAFREGYARGYSEGYDRRFGNGWR